MSNIPAVPTTEAEWTWLYDDYRAGTVFITNDPTGKQAAIAEGLHAVVADRIVKAHNAVVHSLAEARSALGAAYLAGRRSHPSGSQDVDDLAAFFHEEYWEAAGEPHLSREQAVSTDCESCWGSADRLVARLPRNEEADHGIGKPRHSGPPYNDEGIPM